MGGPLLQAQVRGVLRRLLGEFDLCVLESGEHKTRFWDMLEKSQGHWGHVHEPQAVDQEEPDLTSG